MKKNWIWISAGLLGMLIASYILRNAIQEESIMTSKEYLQLPLTRYNDSDCENNYSIGCSMISAENLIDFLGRENVVYLDIRNYEEAEEKRLKGFKVVPFLDLIYSSEKDEEHLYSGTINEPVSNFENADEILHELIPDDQPVFLLCRTGRRVMQLMTLLEAKGYDMDRIYNIGGVEHYTMKMYDDLWIKNSKAAQIDLDEMLQGRHW